MLELTNARLTMKEKWEMTHQELLWWISMCMLIASINFCGNHSKLWEGGSATSKYLPSYNLHAMGMLRNCFDDIWYAVKQSCQPPEQQDGMFWSSTILCWSTTLSSTSMSTAGGCWQPSQGQ
jgi:hypothetical protein